MSQPLPPLSPPPLPPSPLDDNRKAQLAKASGSCSVPRPPIEWALSCRLEKPEKDEWRREWKLELKLYKAAVKGQWKVAVDVINLDTKKWLKQVITETEETVLHVAVRENQILFVSNLLKMMSKEHLELKNKYEDTALCLAAVSGNIGMAILLVKKHPGLLMIRGYRKRLPLFMAVWGGNEEVAWYLYSLMESYLYDENGHGEWHQLRILNASIRTHMFGLAIKLLKKNPRLAYFRDEQQETALFALAQNVKPLTKGHDPFLLVQIIKEKLGKKAKNIVRKVTGSYLAFFQKPVSESELEPHADVEQGSDDKEDDDKDNELWETTLFSRERGVFSRRSEREILGRMLMAEIVKLEPKKIRALICHTKNALTAASKCGNVEVLCTIIDVYPDIVKNRDEEGRTIFHTAILNRHEEIFAMIHKIGALRNQIAIAEMFDVHQDTMLHLVARLPPEEVRKSMRGGPTLEMQRELKWFQAVRDVVGRGVADQVNGDNVKAQDLFQKEHTQLRKEGQEWIKDTANGCSVVAALMAGIAFPVLKDVSSDTNEEFVVTIVIAFSAAISLCSACTSILLFLSILSSTFEDEDFLWSLPWRLGWGFNCLLCSVAAMLLVFVATTFSLFPHRTLIWIPITVSLFAALPILIFCRQIILLCQTLDLSLFKVSTLSKKNKRSIFKRICLRD